MFNSLSLEKGTLQKPKLKTVMYNIKNFIGQFYSQNLYNRPDVLSTNEGPPTDDDSYLGYSVAVGAFGSNSEPGAAVGMPRGNGLLGKVINIKNKSKLFSI